MMSQEVAQTELREQTERPIQGPLKHVRAAALAAALMLLASVAISTAQVPTCGEGSELCGTVFYDLNANGFYDVGEEIGGATVTVCLGTTCDVMTFTDGNGFYSFTNPDVAGGNTYSVSVVIPENATVSTLPGDNDGVLNGAFSTAVLEEWPGFGPPTDFAFIKLPTQGPGTGTPGYWKNHPDAWPVDNIVVGGVTYTKAQAIYWLGKVGKDKRTTMFSSLVPAMLNGLIGNNDICVSDAIFRANEWMKTFGPLGSNPVPVAASSPAWSIGEEWHITMDAYNNGLLCAPHRD